VSEAKILHLFSGNKTFSVTVFAPERSTGGQFKPVKSGPHYHIPYKLTPCGVTGLPSGASPGGG